MSDLVNHPQHYNQSGRKECWDEMIDIFGVHAVILFDVLSAYKYYYRAGEKEGNPKEQDKAKIQNYMNHAKEMFNKIDKNRNHDCELAYLRMYKIMEESEEK